jgi:UDP:flavonoid glycosyltransferase YjiC (YdhE family)
LSSLGLEPVNHMSELVFGRSQALFAPTCSVLEPELAQCCPQINYVGQLVPERMFQDTPEWFASLYRASHEENGLLVYVYLSSLPIGINSKEAFEAICDAFADTPHYVIFGLGKYNEEVVRDISYRDHPRFRFERFVPGESLMERAHMAIFPGTHSMMISAVKHDVPCLIIPDLFERSYNARCMERIGAGTLLEPEAVSPANIRNWAMQQRQGNRTIRSGDHSAKQELQSIDGPGTVIRTLEELAANKGGVKNALQRI